MKIEATRTAAVAAAKSAAIDPKTQQAAQQTFQRAKAAVLAGNLSAFRAELHPLVFQVGKPEDIAMWFGELKGQGIGGWEMGELKMGADGLFAELKGSPKGGVAAFEKDGDKLKLAFLGVIRF